MRPTLHHLLCGPIPPHRTRRERREEEQLSWLCTLWTRDNAVVHRSEGGSRRLLGTRGGCTCPLRARSRIGELAISRHWPDITAPPHHHTTNIARAMFDGKECLIKFPIYTVLCITLLVGDRNTKALGRLAHVRTRPGMVHDAVAWGCSCKMRALGNRSHGDVCD